MVKIGTLFDKEKGSLQSDSNIEGEYDFITASEGWKTHFEYDHECEALVYAVSASGSLGRCHYVNGKFIASNLCLLLTPKNNDLYPVNMQFYSMYFNAIRKRIVNELADGTSKLTISPDELMDYYVEYFPIDQQNKIVKYYNEQITPLKKRLEKAQKEMEQKLSSLL